MAGHRIDRINEEIKKELASIIRELKDPRIDPLVSIISVNTTPDLRFCKVYVSCLEDDKTIETQKGLNSGAGFIRRAVGARINLRYTPQFTFEADNSIKNGVRLSRIIDDISRESKDRNIDNGKDD